MAHGLVSTVTTAGETHRNHSDILPPEPDRTFGDFGRKCEDALSRPDGGCFRPSPFVFIWIEASRFTTLLAASPARRGQMVGYSPAGYGFKRAASVSRKAARLFLSTIVVPVSTRVGMGGHFVKGNLCGPHVQVSCAVFEPLNSCTALWWRSFKNLRP